MTTTTQCVKVSVLRKELGSPDVNLETWMQTPGNVYVGRPGRVFICKGDKKRVFHYPGSKFANPYKIGPEFTLEQALEMYDKYINETGLVDQIEELRGKNLGCFCDQSGGCHAKILASYLN